MSDPQPRTYRVHWASGESDEVLAVNRMEAREAALQIWAGSRTKTSVERVEPLTPTRAERRLVEYHGGNADATYP